MLLFFVFTQDIPCCSINSSRDFVVFTAAHEGPLICFRVLSYRYRVDACETDVNKGVMVETRVGGGVGGDTGGDVGGCVGAGLGTGLGTGVGGLASSRCTEKKKCVSLFGEPK